MLAPYSLWSNFPLYFCTSSEGNKDLSFSQMTLHRNYNSEESSSDVGKLKIRPIWMYRLTEVSMSECRYNEGLVIKWVNKSKTCERLVPGEVITPQSVHCCHRVERQTVIRRGRKKSNHPRHFVQLSQQKSFIIQSGYYIPFSFTALLL